MVEIVNLADRVLHPAPIPEAIKLESVENTQFAPFVSL
jgi:hypothetical protein